jgi:hypothetical protein
MLQRIATARAVTRPKETRKDLHSMLENFQIFKRNESKESTGGAKVNKTKQRGRRI